MITKLVLIINVWILTAIHKADSAVRVLRSDDNSRFVHHFWEPESTTPGLVEISCGSDNPENTKHVNNISTKRFGGQDFRITTERTTTVLDLSRFSKHFLNCSEHTPVEPECYEMLDNGSVYVPTYKRLFNNSDYIIRDTILIICSNFFHNYTVESKFPPALDIVSIVGVVISTFCILLHIVMFVLVRKLRNLPGYCLISLCAALLVAYTCSFILFGLPENSDCTALGMIMFYFFLASFFWMNVMSFDVWRSLRMATSKLRLTADRPMLVRFALYSLYSWGGPLLIVIIALIVDAVGNHPKYKLTFNITTCWFRYKPALYVYFALPLFTLLLVNILFYISSFLMIHNATMNTAENKTDLSSRFFISMRLAVAMGLMWIFGVLATSTQVTALWYLYVLCNTLQGVFIFFSFTLTEKTRKACVNAIQNRKCSMLPTQTSSQQMTTSI